MQAALITGARRLEILEFPEPEPADDGVVVDVTFCGVCGTDVQAFTSGRPYAPAICGHEWTGTVSAVGRSAVGIAEGDRVVVGVPPACGQCASCHAGQTRQCTTAQAFARGREPGAPPHGGFAPRIAVRAGRVIPAHPGLADEVLAQVEPVTVSVHAVNRSALRAGDAAVVLGAGPVGLTTQQCARAAGADQIIVVEPDATRRRLALEGGADRVVEPVGAADLVRELTDGLGVDVVYECAGGTDTLGTAVDLARRGGSVCLVSLNSGSVSIEPGEWLRKEVTVTTALAYVHDEFGAAMDLLADGRVRVDGLHTSTIGLDGLADALDRFAAGDSDQLKVLVDP